MPMSQKQISDFQQKIWNFYHNNKRDLPWRNTKDPYNIFISEVMLQQTQVNRVIYKYTEWIKHFPDFNTLSNAKLSEILNLWSGLGYNRRAKFLQESSKIIIHKFGGKISDNPEVLVKLPGIGKATAASIVVFTYNKPLIFIETNIRRVFIDEFFREKENISDIEILSLVEKTTDLKNPREWYYALMDYGSFLGKRKENPNRKSKIYSKQSTFSGSVRQVRGEILKMLSKGPMNFSELEEKITSNRDHLTTALNQLVLESFLERRGDTIQIKDND